MCVCVCDREELTKIDMNRLRLMEERGLGTENNKY